MTRAPRTHAYSLLMFASLALVSCQLHRPTVAPSRTLELQVLEPELADAPGTVAKNSNAIPIRLLSTESPGHLPMLLR